MFRLHRLRLSTAQKFLTPNPSNSIKMRFLKIILSLALLLGGTSVQAQSSAPGPVKFKREALNFGSRLETTCTSLKVQVVNISDAPISDPGFTLDNPEGFAIQSHFRKCPNPLEPGDTCRIYVNFCPQLVGRYQSKLYFKDTSVYLDLTGKGSRSSN